MMTANYKDQCPPSAASLPQQRNNIRDDRETTRELLDDAMRYLAIDQSRHRDMGQTLAKYVETLQRSNEQLVKLCGLMSKNEKTDELTDKDFAQIFDQIQKSEDK